jgi:Holliday junction resolvasome RuvABC endonuclease subunit
LKTENLDKIRVLGLDPGIKHMGWGAVEATLIKGKLDIKVLGCGKLDFPINSFLTLDESLPDFLGEVWSLYGQYACTHIVQERFQNRGASAAGTSIELIAYMIGALQVFTLDHLGMMTVIPASQWKNRVKRRGIDLKALYRDRTRYYGESHELDGVLQACYGAQIKLGLVPEYAFAFKPIVKQIHEKSSCLETHKRIANLAAKKLKQDQASHVLSRKNTIKRK